jgi:protein-arginine kinase activator protein McsA
MICEACQKQEAAFDWHGCTPAMGREEHAWLCEACAETRMPLGIMKRIREAKAQGKTIAISGWTSYTPQVEGDEKPEGREPQA